MSALTNAINFLTDNYEVVYESKTADARAELAALRARVAELEAAVGEAHVAMIKIGNDLNWDAPADEQLADAINACRYALDAAHPAPEEVTHG
jgi:hypothetical protein